MCTQTRTHHIHLFFRPWRSHGVVISPLFQKPPARPAQGGSPFKPPAASNPQDSFRSSEPIQAFKPPHLHQPAPTEGPKVETIPYTSSAAIPNLAAFQAIQSLISDTPEGLRQLQQLAEQGKLSGNTLENLHNLTEQPRAKGLDGAQLTRETLAILSSPDSNIWQSSRFTCGATNLERQWADQPERFSQVVENLTGLQASTTLISGYTLQRAQGSTDEDGSGRSSVDRVLQSSIMASAGAARGDYSVETDRFGNDPEGGLKIAEIAGITAAAQNRSQVVIAYDSKSARAAQELIGKMEPGESFQAAMTNWEGKEHMLLFQGGQDGSARYFDPADRSQHTIPLRDFLWQTQYLVLPEPMAARVSFGPESIHSKAQIGA
ncbi:hypothetical protein ABS71_09200 [bacterium SCN 62-11]|nr:MAG: hypothetical protein ABS71_09200 [bacterium SCN 62-11]